jgi:hypothetical protein
MNAAEQPAVVNFLYGVAACGSWAVAVCFLRYWRDTGDRLFLMFAGAFVLLSVDWISVVALQPAAEVRHLIYLWRLAAFAVIGAAVWDKNRRRSPRE